MIKIVVVVIMVLLLAVIGIGSYLSPDNLRSCKQMPDVSGDCQKADAVVALSGGNTSVRADEAIALYKNGWSDKLIFSGAAADENSPSNAAVMRRQAINAGVPAERIFVEETARTTHQNARYLDTVFKQNNVRSVILVTSPYHQRRAGLEFEQAVTRDVSLRNHPARDEADWPWYWWATPRGWWLAVGELVKIGATHAGESR